MGINIGEAVEKAYSSSFALQRLRDAVAGENELGLSLKIAENEEPGITDRVEAEIEYIQGKHEEYRKVTALSRPDIYGRGYASPLLQWSSEIGQYFDEVADSLSKNGLPGKFFGGMLKTFADVVAPHRPPRESDLGVVGTAGYLTVAMSYVLGIKTLYQTTGQGEIVAGGLLPVGLPAVLTMMAYSDVETKLQKQKDLICIEDCQVEKMIRDDGHRWVTE